MSAAWWVGLITAYLVPVLIGLVWLGRWNQVEKSTHVGDRLYLSVGHPDHVQARLGAILLWPISAPVAVLIIALRAPFQAGEWLGRLALARQARQDLKVRDRKAYLFEARKAFEQGSPEWHMLDSAIKDLK